MTMAAADTGFRSKPSILVVDDTADNLSLMFGLLKNFYTVRGANNGTSALKVARSNHPPDLILLDIIMPGLSGYEVCQELKSDPFTPRHPDHFPHRAY